MIFHLYYIFNANKKHKNLKNVKTVFDLKIEPSW